MSAISRSWNITKLTFTVIGQDKETLLFPFLASIASILYVAAILVPSSLLQALEDDDTFPNLKKGCLVVLAAQNFETLF